MKCRQFVPFLLFLIAAISCQNSNPVSDVTGPNEYPHWQWTILPDPGDPDKLLLTLSEQENAKGGPESKIVLAEVSGQKLNCREIKIRQNGEHQSFASAKWNPADPGQVFVGFKWKNNEFLVSYDGMKSFSNKHLPAGNFPPQHTTGYNGPRNFVFDRKSDLSIIYSVTGSWLSRDGFNNTEELLMTHDPANRFFGNKGVGFAECAMSVCIREQYTYIATTDHGAWRSNGADTSKWEKISDNKGMPRDGTDRLVQPMAVSEDESVIYLVYHTKGWSDLYHNHKLFLSEDKGETWKDVTEVLGLGSVIYDGIPWMYIDPEDPDNQWIFAGDKLFISTDRGKSFRASAKTGIARPFAWDRKNKILYSGEYGKILTSGDMGSTWEKLPMTFSGMVYSVGVLDNGDLVVGDDGRLLVIPFREIHSPKVLQPMIRMTIGETKAEAAAGLRTFKPILCSGMNIVTFTEPGWNNSNLIRNAGPLLSRDGGKTFDWIAYDLPCTDAPYGIDLKDNRLIIGNRGIYRLDVSSF